MKTLSDMKKGEEERREAAGVLAQVLSPWIEGNTSHGDIDNNLPDIVISLKGRLVTFAACFVTLFIFNVCIKNCILSSLFGVIIEHKRSNSISTALHFFAILCDSTSS